MPRKLRIIGISGAALLCLFTLFSGISHSGVVGSSHDLASENRPMAPGIPFSFKTAQVCVFCHTPHGANPNVNEKTSILKGLGQSYLNTTSTSTNRPLYLWNQSLSNATGAGRGYSVYTSSTTDAAIGEVRVYSLMCLSCHDGVGAMNVLFNPPNFYGYPPAFQIEENDAFGYPVAEGSVTIGESCAPGIDLCAGYNIGERVITSDTGVVNLSNDHPISFDYDSSLVSLDQGGAPTPGLVTPSGGTVGTGNLRLFPRPLDGALVSVECSTCHDPHNQGGADGDPAHPFLVMSNANSALCINCHNK